MNNPFALPQKGLPAAEASLVPPPRMDSEKRLTNVSFRPDLEWTHHVHQHRWVAHDPLNGRFFYFSQIEHDATCLLNGRLSLQDILQQLTSKFPGVHIDQAWLIALLRRLNASQLLMPETTQSVDALLRHRVQSERQTWFQAILSPLSIRVPLLNPQPGLELLRPLARVLFHRITVAFMILVGCVANFSVLSQLLASPDALTVDLSVLQGDRWMWLLACYVVVKSLHELGHGLACVVWGTKCSELGLMFLFFTPCMYCDTTDAWRLSSRWKRAAIGAAGMYIELILAACAAVTWLLTHDGLLHSLAANVMLICSIGTLLVNGNPFLRYDGYYILSDLWGVPNLADQAREASTIAVARLLTGKHIDASHLDRPVWALTAYQAVAFVYRTFIMLMILWLVWTLLVPSGLGLLAVMIMFGTGVGLMLAMIRTSRQFCFQILAHEGLRFTRLVALFVCLLLSVYFVCQVELPVCVQARGVTDFSDKVPLFATENATLLRAAELSKPLPAGAQLVEFDAPDKRYEHQLLKNEIAILVQKIEFLNQVSSIDASTSFELPLTTELLADRRARAQLLETELAHLAHLADKPGRLLPTSLKLNEPLAAPPDLHWQRGPLDEVSQGCNVERGTLLGWFTNQERMEVIAIVSQQDIKQLRLDMLVACRWDCQVDHVLRGQIVRIAPDPIEQTPEELVGDPALISLRNAAGDYAPVEPHYAVTIRVDQPIPDRIRGSLVTVQVHVKSQPLLQTIAHLVRVSLKPLR